MSGKPLFGPDVTNSIVTGGRFILTCSNFAMTAVFSLWLAYNAFTMDTITGRQTFYADRVLQSEEPTSTMPGFGVKYLPTVDATSELTDKVPTMYEIYGVTSVLQLDGIHCNFILFSALWASSAFSLVAIQLPWQRQLSWGKARLFVVHTWNFIGLVITVVIFTATTKWSDIPMSNLFYSLVFQCLGWVYQYFYMVQCTRQRAALAAQKLVAKGALLGAEPAEINTTEMRKLIYTEFSVVMPLILVSTMMPAANGVDAWRVQTVFFGSWTLFTLLGLHLRYRKSLESEEGKQHGFGGHICGLDGLGYLTYAIVLVFLMTLNALGGNTFYDTHYATRAVTDSRWGARLIVIVAGVLLFETLVKSILIRIKHFNLTSTNYKQAGDRLKKGLEDFEENTGLLPAFVGNVLVIAIGSFLVKVFTFAGLVNVNALSLVST